jgi:hypothetical protein
MPPVYNRKEGSPTVMHMRSVASLNADEETSVDACSVNVTEKIVHMTGGGGVKS